MEDEKVTERRKLTRTLACVLTPEEIEERNADLRRALDDIDAAEADLASFKAGCKSQIEQAEAIKNRARGELKEGKIWRPVDCEEVKDFEEGTVIVTRLDTMAVVNSRPLTEDERQLSLGVPGE